MSNLKKDYHKDAAKSRSRKMVADFIIKTFPKESERRDLNYLFLTGPTDAEVREVVDAAGLRRRNAIGIEQDPEAFEMYQSYGTGTQAYNTTLEEFLNKNKNPIDIAFVDFTGTPTEDRYKVLRKVSYQHLSDHGIVATAFSAKRDARSEWMYRDAFMLNQIEGKSASRMNGEKFGNITENLQKANVKDIKSDSITRLFLTQVVHSPPIDVSYVLKYPGFAEAKEELRKAADTLREGTELTSEESQKNIFNTFISEYLIGKNFNKFAEHHNIDPLLLGIPIVVKSAMSINELENHQAYRYVSTDGTPMIGDMASIKRKKLRFANRVKLKLTPDEVSVAGYKKQQTMELVGSDGIKRNVEVGNLSLMVSSMDPLITFDGKPVTDQQKVIRMATPEAKALLENMKKLNEYKPERVDLGSSFKPYARISDIRKAVANGSEEELMKSYRGVTRGRVGAVKAHFTMETYSRDENGGILKSVKLPFQKADDTTKARAVEMIKQNLPTEIICAETNLKPSQIRALKAWDTMRKNK